MFGSSIGSVIGGLINSGRNLPTVDISSLLATINQNKEANASLINNLSPELRRLYDQYATSLGMVGKTLESKTSDIGKTLLDQTKSLYGPNSDAVQATLAALKQQDYSTLPGTIEALKANLAATGGLSRGGASRAITQATLAPAAQYSQQAANVTANQLNQQQAATQQALNKIASMDDNVVQQIFGMSKDEASNILQFGRNDLKDQLSQLINNNNAAAQATLGAQGVAVNNAYQNAVTRDAQQNAIVNGLVNTGVDVASMFAGGGGGGMGLPAGADVGSASYFQNALANSPLRTSSVMPTTAAAYP